MSAPTCPYCGSASKLMRGEDVPGAGPFSRDIYACVPCGAWVGCHPGTTKPLGRLANKELRKWKQRVHALFDPLWRAKIQREGISKGRARRKAYKWLADELGIDIDDCHVGMFDVERCKRAFEILKSVHDGHYKRKETA